MSPQGFSRFSHRWMGRTFAAYVTELRIGSACQILLESDYSIAEVLSFAKMPSGCEMPSHLTVKSTHGGWNSQFDGLQPLVDGR